MKIYDFADLIGCRIRMTRHTKGKWSACIENVRLYDNHHVAAGVHGRGKCAKTALQDYCAQIQGNVIQIQTIDDETLKIRMIYNKAPGVLTA
jgi:hypothetical protein